jgi:transposase
MHRRRVVGNRITYVGLDVHKEGIVVAVAEGGIRGEVREYGRIANTAGALDRLMRKLGGEGVGLRFCYEAGPCGYGIQRHLSAHGHECVVVAPSLIPRRAGDRVKTDRRDAASLARLHRAGELTAVWVPDAGHEAVRDLVRARLDAVHALRRARQQLSGFLLRQGCHYGRPAWTKLHRRSSVRRGGLTKAGNSAARRLLIEASWTYRFPARVSRELLLRQESQPKPIREIAWKAQLRLCARYRKLARTGKPANVVTAAIARELAGFVWAIARHVPIMPG